MHRLLGTLMVFLTLAVASCADPEAAARKQYNEGMTLQRDGRTEEAIQVFEDLVRQYPRTEIVVEVNKLLSALQSVDALSTQFQTEISHMQIDKVKSDIKALEAGLNLYRLDNFRYPSAQQGLSALSVRPSGDPEPRNYRSDGYMRPLPRDPWGNAYRYRNPGQNGPIDVFALTPDGRKIGNWNVREF